MKSRDNALLSMKIVYGTEVKKLLKKNCKRLWKKLWTYISEGGLKLFTEKNLSSIELAYFTIIRADKYDVTVISRNIGHVWYIHNSE